MHIVCDDCRAAAVCLFWLATATAHSLLSTLFCPPIFPGLLSVWLPVFSVVAPVSDPHITVMGSRQQQGCGGVQQGCGGVQPLSAALVPSGARGGSKILISNQHPTHMPSLADQH